MSWQIVDIGSSGLKIADGNYSAKYPNSSEFIKEGVPFIRANNFKNKTIVDDELYFISPEKHSELKKGQLLPDDVLITTRGNIGEVAIVPERHNNSNINAQIVLLRCNKFWIPKFLLFVLTSKFVTEQLPNFITGTALKQLPIKNLRKIKIPLPPLPQQQKIANILDAADALRQKDKALLAKYDELTQSLFLDMFGDPVSNPKGWDESLLKDLCTKITDGTHDTPIRLTEGIKFITGKHIRPFVIDYDNSDYVTEEVHKEIYRRCNPEYGDILYTNIGVNFATAAMNTVDYEFSMKNVALLKYKRELLNGRFLECILNNEFFKDRLKRAFGIGGAQQFLSLSNIKSILVLCPPLALQNQFAERVQVIEQQKAIAQKSLKKSEALFNSLLQKAFKGELI